MNTSHRNKCNGTRILDGFGGCCLPEEIDACNRCHGDGDCSTTSQGQSEQSNSEEFSSPPGNFTDTEEGEFSSNEEDSTVLEETTITSSQDNTFTNDDSSDGSGGTIASRSSYLTYLF
jgi:hypothetical protein